MPQWYEVLDRDGRVILELLAYTCDGALKDARSRGLDNAHSAKRLFSRDWRW